MNLTNLMSKKSTEYFFLKKNVRKFNYRRKKNTTLKKTIF